MKVLFMGSPDFAAVSLRRLYDEGFDIVGVVSVPDKPQGRGKKLTPMPVKVRAEELGIDVFCPQTLKDGTFKDTLDRLSPDVICVVAYGKILPKYVLDYPPYGCINVHGSLLPKYRGAAPMQRAIIDGDTVTGVTTMYMDVALDTGDMLLKEEYEIKETDNFESVHDALAEIGASLLVKTLRKAEDGTLCRIPQDNALATYAEKITKEEGLIDFSLPKRTICNKIRGMSPIPLCYTHTEDGALLKIVSAKISESHGGDIPGTVLSTENGAITVSCGDGAIDITAVLPQGKSRMSAADFIRGRKIAKDQILS